MKHILKVSAILAGVAVALIFVFIIFIYLTNRTVDQTLAKNISVSNDWTEIGAEPPLTAFRVSQELAIAIPNYTLDRNERLPSGEIRLPDGQFTTFQIEGIDASGNAIPFHHGGHTLSERDLIIYRPDQNLGDVRLSRIRIRSDVVVECEEIFWRNRNPK